MNLSEFFENNYEFPLTVRVVKGGEVDHEFVVESDEWGQFLDIQDDVNAGYGECEFIGTSYKDGVLTYEVRDSGQIVYETVQKLKDVLKNELWQNHFISGMDITHINLVKSVLKEKIQSLEDPKIDAKTKIQACRDLLK